MAEPRRPHPLLELTRARLREFWREPASLFWTFGFPILLAIGLGIAFRSSPGETTFRVAVVTEPGTPARAQEILLRDPAFIVLPLSDGDATRSLQRGSVEVVLRELPGDPGAAPIFDLRFDSSRPEAREARLALEARLQEALGGSRPAEIRAAGAPLPGSRYIDFLLPGLLGLNLLGSSMWGIGYAIVQARRQRLLKRFAATPMRRAHYLLAFILSRLVFLLAEVLVLVGFGWLAFDCTIQGSLASYLLVALLGGLSFSGLAVLVASRTGSVEVASGLVNFVTMPMWLLSGAFFSYSRFPEAVQPLLRLLPLTALNDALRGIANEAVGLASLSQELGVLLVWGILPFLLALRLFRWQ
ncbi:MAG: ABC transporter permease [Myxococcota bacterium]|nr:ABC transporter permease [Myxococcota bacterium]